LLILRHLQFRVLLLAGFEDDLIVAEPDGHRGDGALLSVDVSSWVEGGDGFFLEQVLIGGERPWLIAVLKDAALAGFG
jgi:hypothetical protein